MICIPFILSLYVFGSVHFQIQRHTRGLLLCSIGVIGAFDWDLERISYESIRRHFEEVDSVKRLLKDTIYCVNCGKRLVIDQRQESIVYCSCATPMSNSAKMSKPSEKMTVVNAENGEKPWRPYLERQNMIVWRREERPGLYAYKGIYFQWKFSDQNILSIFFSKFYPVYAVYKDVSAEDFLRVQTDIEYRKEWDKTAVALDVIDSDPVHKGKSHIIYWEMLWPVSVLLYIILFEIVQSMALLIVVMNK